MSLCNLGKRFKLHSLKGLKYLLVTFPWSDMDGKTLSLLHWRNWRGNQFRIGTIYMARLKLFQGKAECRRSSRSAGQGLGATWKSMSVESGSHHPLAIHGRCIGRRVWKRWMDKRSGSCLLIDPLCQSLDNNRLLLCGQTTLTSFWWASLSHMLRMSLSLSSSAHTLDWFLRQG